MPCYFCKQPFFKITFAYAQSKIFSFMKSANGPKINTSAKT